MKTLNYFLLIVFLASFFSCGKKSEDNKPLRKDITQAVYSSGKIYPLNNYLVSSKLPGEIQKIFVKVGDTVKAGQAVISIKNQVSELNAETAKNLFDLAQQNADENGNFLSSLKQEVANAKSKYDLDSVNFSRFSNLLKQNATSQINYDQGKTQFEISKQNFLKAKSTLENTRQRLKIELRNAQNQYEAQVSNKNDFTIYSAINGKIYDVNADEGQMASPQMPLMEIGDSKRFEVELMIDETDIGLVKVRQEVVYEIDAFKEKYFKGKITETYPKINPLNKTARVISTIETQEGVEFFSGMSVEANVIIKESKNALVIPKIFLVENHFVQVKGKNELVKIEKGAEDLEFVEVLKGIDEKTELGKK